MGPRGVVGAFGSEADGVVAVSRDRSSVQGRRGVPQCVLVVWRERFSQCRISSGVEKKATIKPLLLNMITSQPTRSGQ